jgi:hypothetical protein
VAVRNPNALHELMFNFKEGSYVAQYRRLSRRTLGRQ